jgi:amino acid permease
VELAIPTLLCLPYVVVINTANIGSGVFIATGKALATGGPGNMLIAYAMVCSCVSTANHSVGNEHIPWATGC